jgi:hypothetical protein
MRRITMVLFSAGMLLAFGTPRSALAQQFSYQGELQQGGSNANGLFDFRFRVFDSEFGGTQVGITTQATTQVTDGRFSTTIAAAAGTFPGATRWLDIAVRPTGVGAFEQLSPRRRIDPAPYAIRSLNERWTPVESTTVRTDPGISSVLINSSAPVFSDTVLMVNRDTTSLGGMYVNTTGANSTPYYGWSANNTWLAEARVDSATGTLSLNMNSTSGTNALMVSSVGRTGLGVAPTGTERLQVNGDIAATGVAKASNFNYATPQTRTMTIPFSAFLADGASAANVNLFNDRFSFASATAEAIAFAPVILPDGVTITSITMQYIDNVAADLTVRLTRGAFAVNGVSQLATGTTSGAVATARSLTVTLSPAHVVDQSTAQYNVDVFCLDWAGASSTAVKAVQITYLLPGPR